MSTHQVCLPEVARPQLAFGSELPAHKLTRSFDPPTRYKEEDGSRDCVTGLAIGRHHLNNLKLYVARTEQSADGSWEKLVDQSAKKEEEWAQMREDKIENYVEPPDGQADNQQHHRQGPLAGYHQWLKKLADEFDRRMMHKEEYWQGRAWNIDDQPPKKDTQPPNPAEPDPKR
ncbi:hypothetical protein SLS55_007245 [Diplodia seriata]|uniref:Uncharacterized protein n=1 Tax=Diplodia seriata TaxID=420778 RepID=A0ABR3CBS9_9PEZI